MSQQYRNIAYLADRGGTAFWRHTQQMMAINCIAQNLNIQYDCMQTPIIDQNFYKGMTSVICQRWISDEHFNLFTKFLKPVMDANCGWLVYAIDDNMSDQSIPLYNRGLAAFEGEKIQGNIKSMLNTADFVVVTTDYIKNFYHSHYGVPIENIIAAPNLLPKWWFGDRYDVDKKLDQFRKFKVKPRIGIISSLSHYNVDDVRETATGKACRKQKRQDGTEVWIDHDKNEIPEAETKIITDDIDDVLECIRSTIDDVQWVFMGYCPPKLKDLADKGKIEVHNGVPILNYSSALENLQLQAIVAPIKDCEFNRCKSHIKYMECAALGVPLFASNYIPYNKHMPASQLFTTSEELKKLIFDLKFSSSGIYKDIIERQWKWLNSPCHEGDFDLRNYWLEDNLNIWIDMFRMRSKHLTISYSNFKKQYEERLKKQAENTIYQDGDVLIVK